MRSSWNGEAGVAEATVHAGSGGKATTGSRPSSGSSSVGGTGAASTGDRVHVQRRRRRAVGAAVAAFAAAVAVVGCSSSGGSSSSSGSKSVAGSSTGATSTTSASGIAFAQAQVKKYAANPPLTVSALPSRPKTSIHAIQINCTIPACAPGAMKPAMAALGWKFDEMTYDISKGPAAMQQTLTQAIAAKPDVILMGVNFPESIFQAQVDKGVKQGIKFVDIGGSVAPGYSACIQCKASLGALGTLAADIALADAGSKTDIAVAFDKAIGPLVAETDAIKKEVATNGDGSRVLDLDQSVGSTPADNTAKTISFLQRNPNVKYLIYTNAAFYPGTALQSAGLGSRVKLVGLYPLNASDVAEVKGGQVFASAVGELGALYWRAADAAARVTMGLKLDPIDPIQSLRVMDRSNANISLLDPANYQSIFKTAWHA